MSAQDVAEPVPRYDPEIRPRPLVVSWSPGRCMEFERAFTIGTRRPADLVCLWLGVVDPYVAAQHAYLEPRPFHGRCRWFVTDLGSLNGTWIMGAGRPIRVEGRRRLRGTEVLRVGETELRLQVPERARGATLGELLTAWDEKHGAAGEARGLITAADADAVTGMPVNDTAGNSGE